MRVERSSTATDEDDQTEKYDADGSSNRSCLSVSELSSAWSSLEFAMPSSQKPDSALPDNTLPLIAAWVGVGSGGIGASGHMK